jgi:ferrochelatase
MSTYDSILLIAFGGPEKPADVRPFLANVVRGRPVPPERLDVVAHHYEIMGGRSPLNERTFEQAAALRLRLRDEGPDLPVYVGMRNWTPYLKETLDRMRSDGCRRAIGFILSAQQSEAGWERYQRNVAEARAAVGAAAPAVDFTGGWALHPLFIEAAAARVTEALAQLPAANRSAARLIFTAHSIPTAMAARSPYVAQVTEGGRLVAERVRMPRWQIAFQSRSGNPREPWLEPDINDALRGAAAEGARTIIVAPIGFVCDHVEVLYDLDVEARQTAADLGLDFVRAPAMNDHPIFIRMMADVIRCFFHQDAQAGAHAGD